MWTFSIVKLSTVDRGNELLNVSLKFVGHSL